MVITVYHTQETLSILKSDDSALLIFDELDLLNLGFPTIISLIDFRRRENSLRHRANGRLRAIGTF